MWFSRRSKFSSMRSVYDILRNLSLKRFRFVGSIADDFLNPAIDIFLRVKSVSYFHGRNVFIRLREQIDNFRHLDRIQGI